MTHEEARDQIVIFMCDEQKVINDRDKQALEMAIQALEQEPTEKPMCDRNICLRNEYNNIGCDECEVTKSQNPKKGHWRHYEGMLICSECGAEFYDDIMEYCGDDVPKCCPNCGCRMVEEQERSE